MNSRKKTIDGENYLTIEALADGLTAKLSSNDCEYCIDGDGDWKSLSRNTVTEKINRGQKLMFRGELIPKPSIGIGTFTVNKNFSLSGNAMSMLFGDDSRNNFSLFGYDNAFLRLFANCTTLKTVSSGFLPATDLGMQCYTDMFQGCTNLTNSPNLPATELIQGCYLYMFQGCTNLTEAPKLPATELAVTCYAYMFDGCVKIDYIKMLATEISASNCLLDWVSGVSSTGTFVKNKDATWDVAGASGVPDGWTVLTE